MSTQYYKLLKYALAIVTLILFFGYTYLSSGHSITLLVGKTENKTKETFICQK